MKFLYAVIYLFKKFIMTLKSLEELACNQILINYFKYGVYEDVLYRIFAYVNVIYLNGDLEYVRLRMLLRDFVDLLKHIKLYSYIYNVKNVIKLKVLYLTNSHIKLLPDCGYNPHCKLALKKLN